MKFDENELEIILSALWYYSDDLEERIEETRKFIRKRGQFNRLEETMKDGYTLKGLMIDIKTLKRVKNLMEKILE